MDEKELFCWQRGFDYQDHLRACMKAAIVLIPATFQHITMLQYPLRAIHWRMLTQPKESKATRNGYNSLPVETSCFHITACNSFRELASL